MLTVRYIISYYTIPPGGPRRSPRQLGTCSGRARRGSAGRARGAGRPCTDPRAAFYMILYRITI